MEIILLKDINTIKEVTHMSGFNSTAYFSKTFKDLFEVTPSQYIEQHENSKKTKNENDTNDDE